MSDSQEQNKRKIGSTLKQQWTQKNDLTGHKLSWKTKKKITTNNRIKDEHKKSRIPET